MTHRTIFPVVSKDDIYRYHNMDRVQCAHCGGHFNPQQQEIRPVYVIAGDFAGKDDLCKECEEKYYETLNP